MAKLMSEALVVGYAQMREDVDEALGKLVRGELVEDGGVPGEVIGYAVEVMAKEIGAAKAPAARLWEKAMSCISLLATLEGSSFRAVAWMIAYELREIEERAEAEGVGYWSEDGKRARKGVKALLERKGYEIVAEDFEFDGGAVPFVMEDDGYLVFVEVNASDDPTADFDEIEAGGMTRSEFERAMIAYLEGHEREDSPIRFDSVCIRMTGEKKAVIRHHINCMEAM